MQPVRVARGIYNSSGGGGANIHSARSPRLWGVGVKGRGALGCRLWAPKKQPQRLPSMQKQGLHEAPYSFGGGHLDVLGLHP